MEKTVDNQKADSDSGPAGNKNVTRRDFITLTANSMLGVGAITILWPLIDSMNPSAEVLALASTEVDLTAIQPGQTIKVMWRGKPVFIRNRTEKEITKAKSVPLRELIDPQTDEERTKEGKENWLVMVGVCTHLGCIPLDQQGDYNGWFCPCHGSHYDISGRIRKGPAPYNLAIPPYEFISDTKILIG